MTKVDSAAKRLAEMYAEEFGGKPSGRYRIARKLLAELVGQRRLYAEDVIALTRALLEQGFILIDMESFFVVMSANAFVNYRRAGNVLRARAAQNHNDRVGLTGVIRSIAAYSPDPSRAPSVDGPKQPSVWVNVAAMQLPQSGHPTYS